MILRLVLILLPVIGIRAVDFDKSGFYAVFEKGNISDINRELSGIAAVSFPEKRAYEGALLMKKAGLRTLPQDKLKDFRSGCSRLEAAIAADSANAEYRFLRLCIQEQAPSFLGYRSSLQRDNLYIQQHFGEMTPVVQNAIREYSKRSHILRPDNL